MTDNNENECEHQWIANLFMEQRENIEDDGFSQSAKSKLALLHIRKKAIPLISLLLGLLIAGPALFSLMMLNFNLTLEGLFTLSNDQLALGLGLSSFTLLFWLVKCKT